MAEAIELPTSRAASIQADRRDDFDALMKLQSIIGAPSNQRVSSLRTFPKSLSGPTDPRPGDPQLNEPRLVHLAGGINQRSIEGEVACVSFAWEPDIRLRDRTLAKSAPTLPPTIHPRPTSRGLCLELGTSGSASAGWNEDHLVRSRRET